MTCELTIAIATNSENLIDLKLKLMNYLNDLDDNVIFLVSYQTHEHIIISDDDRVRFIFNDRKGLSSNRNLCIENCKTKWIWFQDDDIELNVDIVNKLIKSREFNSHDLLLVRVGSLENRSEYYKKYNFSRVGKYFLPFKVSSIEIMVNCDFIKKYKIRFDENLGLGTSLPSGEENLFVNKILQCNAKYKTLNSVACYHTTLEDNRQSKGKQYHMSKGYVLSQINILLAILLSFRWALRERNSLGFFKVIKLHLSGFKQGLLANKRKI